MSKWKAYSSDYVEYDEYGLLRVRCMICGVLVGERGYREMPDKKNIGKTVQVMGFRRFSNWRQRRMLREVDGVGNTHVEPIVCVNCLNAKVNTEKLNDQIRDGMLKEMEHTGKPEAVIDAYKERHKKITITKEVKMATKPKRAVMNHGR